MTHKFSKRIANNTKRSVRKHAIGGRPITAAEFSKEKPEIIVFSATNTNNEQIKDIDGKEMKLYVKKGKTVMNFPKYTIYDNIEMKTPYANGGETYSNLSFEDFSGKIKDITNKYFGADQEIKCTDTLLFTAMNANHKFSKLNDTLCKGSDMNRHKKGFFKKTFYNYLKLDLNAKLGAKCSTFINLATNAMINQARFANFGLLTTGITVGIAAVSSLMVAAGASATTIVGLPVAAGLMALALVANQIVRLAIKNVELKSVMFLIWGMCTRFENLVNLMIKMADRLEFDINAALTPVKAVMERLITQICKLAPKATFNEMKGKTHRDGAYDITKVMNQSAPIDEYTSRVDDKSSSFLRKLSRISSPDENYRVLIRDICILGIWFSIIFSDFMLVAGVRNDVIKHKLKHQLSMYDIENETDLNKKIVFIQAQLDYMNDIHETEEYKQLLTGPPPPLRINEKSLLRKDKTTAELELKRRAEIDAAIKAGADKYLEAMEANNNVSQKENLKALYKLIDTDEMKLHIEDCSDQISKSYLELASKPHYKDTLPQFLPGIIEKDNMDPSDGEITALKNGTDMKMFGPILLNYMIMIMTYDKLSTSENVLITEDLKRGFEAAKLLFEGKYNKIETTINPPSVDTVHVEAWGS